MFFAPIFLSLSLLFSASTLYAQSEKQTSTETLASEEEIPAYWEYGAGFGFIHFEQYPASGQHRELFLPFPTFQYRGKILRADDRDGAHAYIFKNQIWTLEFSGAGYPSLESSANKAREGMDDLPWLIALGPKAVTKLNDQTELSFSAYQATATDFKDTRFSGGIFQAKIGYRWESEQMQFARLEPGRFFGNLSYNVKFGTKEFLNLYYSVPTSKATATRNTYEAQAGQLSHELTYFQRYKSGRASFYLGASIEDYSVSANRASPLHKEDQNINYLLGMTYVLGESTKREVPEEDTSGVINRLRESTLKGPAPK